MGAEVLRARGLTLRYGGSQVLHGVDLDAHEGEVTCVMGVNGVGKTSLLKAISSAHPRSGGEVVLGGEPLGRLRAHQIARRGVAVVPQGRDVFPLMTVQENLETGFAVLPRAERRVPDEVHELFPVLREMAGRRGGDLSGGQQQQLAIGRALVMRPRLLLLDEPTEGIQPSIIRQIGRVIERLRERGDMAVVLVEQYFDFAWGLADRIVVLSRGEVAWSGRRTEITRDELLAMVSV